MDPTEGLYVFAFAFAVNETTIPQMPGHSPVTISTALPRPLVSQLQLTTGIGHETSILIKLKALCMVDMTTIP
jgi:hypothetical protein